MSITKMPEQDGETSWLLFMFHLSASRASKRVGIWRKLQKYGTLNWKNCAYLLPFNENNLERFEWLVAEVRKYQGDASIAALARVYGHTNREIGMLFNKGRAPQYEAIIRDLRLALRGAASRSRAQLLLDFGRLNRRFSELNTIDFFGCTRRKEAEGLIKELEQRARLDEAVEASSQRRRRGFHDRIWQTRPRPKVDRVGSAWLIKHFIDPKAKFVFSSDPEAHAGAVRFDMFDGEFTHVGEDCTFETLMRHFNLRDKRLTQIAQMVHDADLEDNKYGRPEGRSIELITLGWGRMEWSDSEILSRGFELFDALYLTLGPK